MSFLLFEGGGGGGSSRPAPVQQSALPPFDPNDAGGIVHTTLPPEQAIPDHFTDPAFMRADFNGVTLPGHYTGNQTDGWTITDGRWAGLHVPFKVGANTTPPTMIMTPMLILYPQDVQHAVLTEHAERGYDDFIFECDPESWNLGANGQDCSPSAILAWVNVLAGWGFRPVLWRGNPTHGVDGMLQVLMGGISWYIHGEEVDSKMTSEAYELSLKLVDAYINSRIPIGVHFTADADRKMGYPLGFPRDTFLNDWSPYNGRVHLMLQLDVDGSAGLQGAAMYYARLHVNCGIGDAARGPGAPDSRVIAFETSAEAQLMGQRDETYGCLRSWELLCGTRDNPKARPVSGSGNGIRRPDGSTA